MSQFGGPNPEMITKAVALARAFRLDHAPALEWPGAQTLRVQGLKYDSAFGPKNCGMNGSWAKTLLFGSLDPATSRFLEQLSRRFSRLFLRRSMSV